MLTTPIIAMSLLIVIIYLLARWTGVIQYKNDGNYLSDGESLTPAGFLRGIRDLFAGTASTSYAWDGYCENCDDDCEPDCDCECHVIFECHIGELDDDAPYGVISESAAEVIPLEMAVEVNHADSLSELEWRAMFLRANSPHLFRDNWYEESRKVFSRWAADEWEKIDLYQREMRIGVYAA